MMFARRIASAALLSACFACASDDAAAPKQLPTLAIPVQTATAFTSVGVSSNRAAAKPSAPAPSPTLPPAAPPEAPAPQATASLAETPPAVASPGTPLPLTPPGPAPQSASVPPRTWQDAQPLTVKDRPPATPEQPAPSPPPASIASPAPATAPPPVQLFPGVRVDRAARTVEFEATVPIDAHDATSPNVYLELIACTPDSREHESLFVTKARASQVHAALLLLGLEPGKPGRIDFTGPRPVMIEPVGPAVSIDVTWHDGDRTLTRRVEELVRHFKTGQHLPDQTWLFAGSRFVTKPDAGGKPVERYDADGAGTLIGLATFGSETIAPKEVFSPDSGVNEAVWIASTAMPKIGTGVTIRLRPVSVER